MKTDECHKQTTTSPKPTKVATTESPKSSTTVATATSPIPTTVATPSSHTTTSLFRAIAVYWVILGFEKFLS